MPTLCPLLLDAKQPGASDACRGHATPQCKALAEDGHNRALAHETGTQVSEEGEKIADRDDAIATKLINVKPVAIGFGPCRPRSGRGSCGAVETDGEVANAHKAAAGALGLWRTWRWLRRVGRRVRVR